VAAGRPSSGSGVGEGISFIPRKWEKGCLGGDTRRQAIPGEKEISRGRGRLRDYSIETHKEKGAGSQEDCTRPVRRDDEGGPQGAHHMREEASPRESSMGDGHLGCGKDRKANRKAKTPARAKGPKPPDLKIGNRGSREKAKKLGQEGGGGDRNWEQSELEK